MQDQYIEMSTAVAEDAALYGLGERTSSTGLELQRNGVPLALWNRDHQAALPDQNVYGSHPILMDVRAGAPCCIPPLLHRSPPGLGCPHLRRARELFGHAAGVGSGAGSRLRGYMSAQSRCVCGLKLHS